MAAPYQNSPATVTSVDKTELTRWRFGECNGFVVKDWTGLEKGGEPACIVLKATDIFDFIADAATNQRKVAIYAIGPCVIDWSNHGC
jgi:hypothetical protein